LQTTLLTIAIAVILALIAALVAPFFINWGDYRVVLEREAARLTGLEIKVDGDIEARLLPSPRLQLQDVSIGSGEERLRARALTIEFALSPLMRGEWRAAELHLAGPQLTLSLDDKGHLGGPGFSLNFDPDAVTVERLSIDDGKIQLDDAASHGVFALEKLWFNGELRSLAGPLRGEGAVTVGGELYPFRISTGRLTDAGALRLRLNVDPVNVLLNVEADGTLAVAGDKPQFDGTLNVSRPVGIAARNAASLVTQPWRAGGKIKVTPASALIQDVDFQYGSDAQAVRLSGTAELRLGPRPRFDGVLSARQIDLDRLAGESEGTGQLPPAATIRRLAASVGQAFKPPFPVQIGLGIDQVTLGGADITAVRGDVTTAANGWTLDRFEFRAPGFTQVQMSGALNVAPTGVVFIGPAEIAANDPQALAAWLEGRQEKQGGRGMARPLRVRGDLTLGTEKVAIERLNASFDRGNISGRFAYVFAAGGKGARIDTALNAAELDLDAANAFTRALLAGSAVEPPTEAALSLELGRASFAGFEAGKTSARLQYDKTGLKIERLTIENFGGANLAASGQIALAPVPHGSVALDLDARDLAGVNALVGRYTPEMAARLRGAVASLAPARLRATLKIEDAASGSRASIGVEGTAGALKVNLDAQSGIDLSSPAASGGNLRFNGRLDTNNTQVLTALLGLDAYFAVGKEPGTLTMKATGAALGTLQVDGRLAGGGLDVAAAGTTQFVPGEIPQATLKVNLARANLAPFRGGTSLPVSVNARVGLGNDRLTLDDLSGNLAGSPVRGKLALTLTSPRKLSGDIDSDALDAGALIGAAIGMPAGGALWNWPADPFNARLPGGIEGAVAVHAMRAALTPALTARELRATLQLSPGEIAVRDIAATVADGALKGRVSFKGTAEGVATQAQLSLANADVTAFLPAAARPPLTGRLTLETQIEGEGRSPQALVGSLQGSGGVTLENGQIAGLDPRVFAAVTRAVEQGLPIEASRVASLAGNALASGHLQIKRAEGELAINAGQIRLSNARADGDGADVALTGALDLTIGTLDARLILSGSERSAGGTRPDIFLALRGPLSSPDRTIDVSAFTGWLTLREIERQSKKLESIEATPSVPPMAPAAPIDPPPRPERVAPVTPVTPAKPMRLPAARTGQAPPLPPPLNIVPGMPPALVR
jgi:large subunit ribosomal protein L24